VRESGDGRKVLIHGGTVLPCTGQAVRHEALVLDGDRVLAAGSKEEMRAVAGSAPVTINVDGATVLPGLVDTHPHAMHFNAFRIALVDLSDARNHDDIVKRIGARAAVTPAGQWILCSPVGEAHYFIRRSWRDLEERRLPDRTVLDRAAPAHPVMIQAWAPHTPNVVAFNSMALQRLGLSRITPPRVCDVWVERDHSGELTGILRGSVNNYYTHDPFWLQIWSRLPSPPPEIWELGGRAGMAEMNSLGVTTIYESHIMDPVHVDAYRRLRAAEAMSCRVLTTLEAASQAFDPHNQPDAAQLGATLDLALSLTDTGDDWLRHDGVTVARSGPCFPGFINLYEPFRDPYGRLVYGVEFLPKRVEEQVVHYCMERSLRLNVLAATPKDHDDFFHTAGRHDARTIRDRGWVLQHALLVNDGDARRYAELGMSVTTSKGFHWGKGDMYGERIGRHTWQDLIPLKRWLDHGVKVGCGTDWGPRNVFEQIQLAVTCEFAGSGYRNLDAGQAIDREQALLMWTRDAAAVLGWQGVGSLRPGGHADLVIVDRDPLDCPLEDLPATRVLRTIVGGRTVFDAGVLAA
jgi:hypothetical protein